MDKIQDLQDPTTTSLNKIQDPQDPATSLGDKIHNPLDLSTKWQYRIQDPPRSQILDLADRGSWIFLGSWHMSELKAICFLLLFIDNYAHIHASASPYIFWESTSYFKQ
jgi:hypothetical protein